MRYSFGFLFACALSVLLLGGCGETVLCEGVVCEDDGNECTDGVCDPATGTCQHTTVEDDTACDFDGLPGLCKAGVCEDAMLCEGVECEDDDNECTDDVCDPATGMCGHVTVEDDTACDFGGLPGLCKAGVCVDAMLCVGVECDDGNECTNDVCVPATGNCDHTPVEDGTGCADGVCRQGVCGPLCVANICECSEAGIRAAIEGGGDYPYRFNCDGPTTVTTNAEIGIDNDVILDGEDNLTVDANEAHRVFSVANNVAAELRGMTVTRGTANGDGGGILNDGMLTLTNCKVSSNSSASDGGGIWNQGTLTLTESAITDNTAANSGGGIENNSGSTELNRCTVSGNTAMDGGGGAIESGGAEALLLLINTTVSGNVPSPGRGAIENDAWAVVSSSTLQQLPVGNERYVLAGSGWVELRNTILNGECVGWREVGSYGGNIESPGDSCGLWYDDLVYVSEAELDLGPLQDNGGPTLTHLPGPSSFAIDRIEPGNCVDANWEPLETDQRGVGRPQGSLCDVGSVEADSLCGGDDCDDQNECTRDRCNPADASCSYEPVPDGWYCELGGGGSGGTGGSVPGVCFQGECTENLCWDNPCDDGNDCTWDDCSLPDGSCSDTNVPDGYDCMYGAGQCLDGVCELLYPLCGAERSIPPTATTDTGLLACEYIGLPIEIAVTMAVTPLTAVQEGPIDFETQFEFTLLPGFYVGIGAFTIESLGATIDATMGDSSPTPVWVYESPVPCVGILEPDTPYSVVTPITNATWTLDIGAVLELTAQHFEQIVDGILITTEEPVANCVWETLPPAVSFTAAP